MSNLTKYKIVTFIRYFAESLFFPFLSLYFSNIGLGTSKIGIILSIIPIVGLLANPIYSKLCKNIKTIKIFLAFMSLLEAMLVIMLFFNHSFIYNLIIVIFIALISSSNYGLIDSLITNVAKECDTTYSSIRVFGSFSYMIGAFGAGFIAKYLGYEKLFIMASVLFLATSIMYFLCKNPDEEVVTIKTSYKELFKNKKYMFYLLFYTLLIGSMQVTDDFFSLYIKDKGAVEFYYSYVMLGFILVEVIVLNVLSKIGYKFKMKLYFISVTVLIIKLFIQSIPSINIYLLMTSQLLRGIIWGIALYLSSTYIIKILPHGLGTKGIMLVLQTIQLFGAIFKFFGGYIIEGIGYSNFYLIFAIISICALVVYILYYIKYLKAKHNIVA